MGVVDVAEVGAGASVVMGVVGVAEVGGGVEPASGEVHGLPIIEPPEAIVIQSNRAKCGSIVDAQSAPSAEP